MLRVSHQANLEDTFTSKWMTCCLVTGFAADTHMRMSTLAGTAQAPQWTRTKDACAGISDLGYCHVSAALSAKWWVKRKGHRDVPHDDMPQQRARNRPVTTRGRHSFLDRIGSIN